MAVLKVWDGSAWVAVGLGVGGGNPAVALTPPVLADWAWVNQGDATAADTPMGIAVAAPVNSGNQLRLLARALPGAPYTLTVKATGASLEQNYESFGVALRESGSGKLANLALSQGPYVLAQKFSGPSNNFVATYVAATSHGPVEWFQIADDGTTRSYRISRDGVAWRLLHAVGRTDYLTPDQFCLLAGPALAGVPGAVLFAHYGTASGPTYI